jgi:hypothetical protein
MELLWKEALEQFIVPVSPSGGMELYSGYGVVLLSLVMSVRYFMRGLVGPLDR